MKKCASLALAAVASWIALGLSGASSASTAAVGRLDEGGLRARSRRVLATLAARHGLALDADLQEKALALDRLGMAHRRLQQTYRGVPVLGGEAIVHLGSDGVVRRVTDALVPRVQADAAPLFGGREAQRRALREYGCEACLTAEPRSDLWILRTGLRDRLVWRVRLRREDGTDRTALPVFFIDARSGETVFRYDDLQTAAGTGESLYRGTVPMETYFRARGAVYLAEDVGRKIGTLDSRNRTQLSYRFQDADNVWDAPVQRAAAGVHWGASMMKDYLQAVHGRNGLDGLGGPGTTRSRDGVTRLISSRVHYGSSYNNAFFNGLYMSYGDGDGNVFSPLVALDIVGHEMQHGVTLFSEALFYFNEPGALNESWSDVFGTLLERHLDPAGFNWRIGEDCYTPANGTADALRHMDDPHAAEDAGFTVDDDPDHYSERYRGPADNGGVHINSGIANKAFYLVSEGGSHHLGGVMTGIGADKAGQIWYRAVTTYMTVLTRFAGARTATLNAAADLYGSGSAEEAAVCQAWTLVGVGSACP
jgi:Zn-dependent metalloprotease